jgi:hypothetical protein
MPKLPAIAVALVVILAAPAAAGPITFHPTVLSDEFDTYSYPVAAGGSVAFSAAAVGGSPTLYVSDLSGDTAPLVPGEVIGHNFAFDGQSAVWYGQSGHAYYFDGRDVDWVPGVRHGHYSIDQGVVAYSPSGPDWHRDVHTWTPGSAAPLNVTNRESPDRGPSISGDQVAWIGRETSSDEIYLGSTAGGFSRITSDGTSGIPNSGMAKRSVSLDSGQIAWTAKVGDHYQVFFDDRSGEPVQITRDPVDHFISETALEGGRIVWHASDGNDMEVFYWDGKETHQVTRNDSEDSYPSLSEGIVAWHSRGSSGDEAILTASSQRTYALVFGSFDGPRHLGDEDAQAFADALTWATDTKVRFVDYGSPSGGYYLDVMVPAFEELLGGLNLTSADTLIFYYSGHGDDGEIHPQSSGPIRDKAIASLLSEYASNARKIVILDSCGAGGFWDDEDDLRDLGNTLFLGGSGKHAISSWTGSVSNPINGRGFFTTRLIELLSEGRTWDSVHLLMAAHWWYIGKASEGFEGWYRYSENGFGPATMPFIRWSSDFDLNVRLDGRAVPESGAVLLFGLGVVVLAGLARQRRRTGVTSRKPSPRR